MRVLTNGFVKGRITVGFVNASIFPRSLLYATEEEAHQAFSRPNQDQLATSTGHWWQAAAEAERARAEAEERAQSLELPEQE